jgi:hypothetical protein
MEGKQTKKCVNLKKLFREFVKEYPDFGTKKYNNEELERMAIDYVKSKADQFKKEGRKKYWLVFESDEGEDGGGNEACSALYSDLVRCHTKEEAILLILIVNRASKPSEYDAIEMDLKKI